jgi:O-antigen ligase
MAVAGNPMEEWSAAYRIYEFKNILLTVADSPWVGYPLGVPWKVHTLFPFGAVLSPIGAHDVYVYILFRNGIIGMVLLLYFIFMTVRIMMRCVRGARSAFEKICAMSLLGWWALYLLASFTAPLLTTSRSAVIGGIILALTALLEGNLREPSAEIVPVASPTTGEGV